MKMVNLGNGSSGNAMIISNGKDSVLVDIGFSYSNMTKRNGKNRLPDYAVISLDARKNNKFADEFKQHGEILEPNFGRATTFNSMAVMRTANGLLIVDKKDKVLIHHGASKIESFSGVTVLVVECAYSRESMSPENSEIHNIALTQKKDLEDLLIDLQRFDTSKLKKIALVGVSVDNLDMAQAISRIQKQTNIITKCALKKGGFKGVKL